MIFNIFCALQRFFDKAAVAEAGGGNSAETASPWRLCTVTQVEEVKGLLRCLPIALSTMLLYMVLAQVQTWTIQQGYTMERRIGAHYLIPPATLSAIAIAVVLLEVGAYDFFLVPVLRRMTGSIHGLSHLQRIGMGLALSIVGLAYAALLESIRLAMAKSHHLVSQSGSNAAIVPLSIFWQMPILVIMGTAIFFAHAGLFEFFYYESPVRMRSLGTALSMLPIAMGLFQNGGFLAAVNAFTKKVGGKGWLESQDLNHNHLNYFFLLMAVMSLINFVVYLITARYYEYKEFINIASVCTKKSRHPSPRGDNPPLEAQSSQSASSVTLHL
jgi:peptide/histidine transporter 3/4